MATPKFDLVNTSLATRIGDPVASASTNGTVLTAAERNTYVNRAANKLFSDAWYSTGGNGEVFLGIFPELFSERTVACSIISDNCYYTIASPNKDIYKIEKAIGGSSGKYIQVFPVTMFAVLKSEVHPHYVFTSDNPALIHKDEKIYIFPGDIVASPSTYSVDLQCIVMPVDPTTGLYLAQGGSYDLPFDYSWLNKLAEIAEQLYRIDAQETI